MTERERRLHLGEIYAIQAAECLREIEFNAALHVLRPDLQRKVERLRGSLRWLAKELRRELERGGTTDTTGRCATVNDPSR